MAEEGTVEYTVHLCVILRHEDGPEPEWDDVARSVAASAEGGGGTIYVPAPGRPAWAGSTVRVVRAEVDQAEELDA